MLSLLLTLGLIGACCDKEQIKPVLKPLLPAQSISDDAIVSYFASQIEKEVRDDAPEAAYRDYVKLEEDTRVRRAVWELWCRANNDRLKANKWEVKSSSNTIHWSIPMGEQMRLRLITKGEKPVAGYPLFINLHGGGSYPDVSSAWGSMINEDEWFAALDLSSSYKDAPSFYFVPRMPDDRKGRWHYMPRRMAIRRTFELSAISGDVDMDRVYLTGISEGGYGTLRIGLFMPDYFAGLGPIAAVTNSLDLCENLRNVAFRLDVGGADYQFGRTHYAYKWQSRLTELADKHPNDFIHQVKIHANYGHAIPYGEVTPWLTSHKRRTYPARITYLYYDIDDGYSSGVYYLNFKGLCPTPKAKALFDVVHKGNTYMVKLAKISGSISGILTIYIDQVDLSKPVTVIYNGQKVYEDKVVLSKGVMMEAIAHYGDPRRIFPAKVTIPISIN